MKADDERLTYEELIKEIHSCPRTWLPALIHVCVRSAVERGIIKDYDAALKFVANLKDDPKNKTQ